MSYTVECLCSSDKEFILDRFWKKLLVNKGVNKNES